MRKTKKKAEVGGYRRQPNKKPRKGSAVAPKLAPLTQTVKRDVSGGFTAMTKWGPRTVEGIALDELFALTRDAYGQNITHMPTGFVALRLPDLPQWLSVEEAARVIVKRLRALPIDWSATLAELTRQLVLLGEAGAAPVHADITMAEVARV
jgi:hypothetical protein